MGQQPTNELIPPPCSYDISLPHLKFFRVKNSIKVVPVLEIKPKYPKAVLLYSHQSGIDLGMIHDHLVDISDALSIIIISYDYPGFGMTKDEETNFNNATESGYAILSYTLELSKSTNIPLILYGCEEGYVITERLHRKRPRLEFIYQEATTELNIIIERIQETIVHTQKVIT